MRGVLLAMGVAFMFFLGQAHLQELLLMADESIMERVMRRDSGLCGSSLKLAVF